MTRLEEVFLPLEVIDRSPDTEGSVALKAVSEGKMVVGKIVVISGFRNHIDFLYVRHGSQGKGIGQKIFELIEKMYSEVKVWETCTPYFEVRNLHFYINCLHFSEVEFFNEKHPDPHYLKEGRVSDQEDYF